MTTEAKTGFDAIGAVPVCKSCGSERVVTEAWACWNRNAGLWELETRFEAAYCRACARETTLEWTRPGGPTNRCVRDLNDAFRKQGSGRGSVLVTEGVSALGADFVTKSVVAVRGFDGFNQENDPWGEHDFGALEIDGLEIFWKIDSYDLDLQMQSPNPANPAVTHRVLTIMLGHEN